MQFLSDNAAAVHPRVWDAMRDTDTADAPYDGDALSRELDARFTDLFGRECAVLWVATGTAANCLALATMVPPHGGVVCHREAHIEQDEGGAPGFYLHGAKLLLAEGEGAKLTPDAIGAVIDPIRDDVHQVQPHAISLTQAANTGAAIAPPNSPPSVHWPKSAACRCMSTGHGSPMRSLSSIAPRPRRSVRRRRSVSAV